MALFFFFSSPRLFLDPGAQTFLRPYFPYPPPKGLHGLHLSFSFNFPYPPPFSLMFIFNFTSFSYVRPSGGLSGSCQSKSGSALGPVLYNVYSMVTVLALAACLHCKRLTLTNAPFCNHSSDRCHSHMGTIAGPLFSPYIFLFDDPLEKLIDFWLAGAVARVHIRHTWLILSGGPIKLFSSRA